MDDKTLLDPERCARMQRAVIEAGVYLRNRAMFIQTVDGTSPTDENPHTNLDLEVDDVLKKLLPGAFDVRPDPIWLTEERPAPAERLGADRVFIIDPIDGTRNVLAGRGEACISAALWERGRGVTWGCVHNPFTDETFTAVAGQGARLNGNRIYVSEVEDVRHAMFLVSIHESVKGMLDRVKSQIKVRPVGSIAYKMCLVAAGRGDATFTVNPRHDWDIAAAMLIVREAGGMVTDAFGNWPELNGENTELGGVAVSNGPLHDGVIGICGMVRAALDAAGVNR